MRFWTMIAGFAVVLVAGPLMLNAQDRLRSMPGYDQYVKMSKQIPGSVTSGAVSVTWKYEGKSFEYEKGDVLLRYDIASAKSEEIGKAKAGAKKGGGGFGKGKGKGGDGGGFGKGKGKGGGEGPVARGRQSTSATSPDGKLKAVYRDFNLWIVDVATGKEFAVTTEGNAKGRLKFGTGSWVYGEELAQRTAMWWSPDSKRLAFYRMDESKVPDFYLTLGQTKVQSTLDVEPYPKAGAPNPIADICFYDLASKKMLMADVRDGKAFENNVVGHYVYHATWSPDGTELQFNRTNRLQNILEFVACNPETGKCRVIVREEWPASWVTNAPPMRYLNDKNRFLWVSERNGYKNLYLYDLTGKMHNAVTSHPFEVANVVRVDEKAGLLYYVARSGDNHMKMQLHRVGLDGKNDQRITDPKLNHSVDIAPDGKHFIDIADTHDTPPTTRLLDENGKVLAELARSDTSRYEKLGLKRTELITFKAGDGKTDLYGMLSFPSNFDPKKKYPLLVSVYAGPNTNKARESFTMPDALTEYGFLVAAFDSRTASGRGKQFIDAIYGKLGVVEIDDQAAGVKALWDRPYLDKTRVGIYGSSYGGYASALCILRHPEVFQAACASSPVTDYRLYDSIYTERYMGLPQDNKAGYDAGSAMTHASKLKGRLMLFFGTADNNVHPTNTMQLVKALQGAGKSFELQVGPDVGHAALSQPRMMEFFIESLVMRK